MYIQRNVSGKWCIYKETYPVNDVFKKNVSGKWCIYKETYPVNDVFKKNVSGKWCIYKETLSNKLCIVHTYKLTNKFPVNTRSASHSPRIAAEQLATAPAVATGRGANCPRMCRRCCHTHPCGTPRPDSDRIRHGKVLSGNHLRMHGSQMLWVK